MEKVRTALIASGGGTDAYAIMTAYNSGQIPNIDLQLLISTKSDAGCLEKANSCNIPAITLDRKKSDGRVAFNENLVTNLQLQKIKLVFLVGCIVKIPTMQGITIYNIHPADIETCGGAGMYGLEPHKKVLTDITDLISRGKKDLFKDRFYTEPTVHEVEPKYDSGQCLLRLKVEIPKKIIHDFINKPENREEIAAKLQQHVLPYEWMILPLAVNIAAAKIQQNHLP